jgi:hypothetical protein
MIGVWVWLAVVVMTVAAAGIYVRRRDVAEMEAQLAGGSMPPGCVTAQAAAILLLAALLALVKVLGKFGL